MQILECFLDQPLYIYLIPKYRTNKVLSSYIIFYTTIYNLLSVITLNLKPNFGFKSRVIIERSNNITSDVLEHKWQASLKLHYKRLILTSTLKLLRKSQVNITCIR